MWDNNGAVRTPETAAAAILLTPIIGEAIGDDVLAATVFWWAADICSEFVVSICEDEADSDVDEAAATAASDNSDPCCVTLFCCGDCFMDRSVGAMDDARLRPMPPPDADVGGGGGDEAPKNCCWYCC